MIRFQSVATCAVAASLVCLLATAAPGQSAVPRILNGTPTTDFDAVGIVGSQEFGGFCTGTLISPFHVLTAGHCAEFIEGPTAGTFELESGVYTTQAVFIHPDYDPITLDNDIAILELSQPALEAPAFVFDGTPLPGDELVLVGFGGGGDAGGSDGTFGVKRFGFVTIDMVEPTLIIWTFDDPLESNTAPGDSGGPGFIEIGDELFIASITSGGSTVDAGLGDIAFNTRADAYVDWIDMIIMNMPEQPGAEPAEEPGPVETPPGGMCPIGGNLPEVVVAIWSQLQEIVAEIQSWIEPIRELWEQKLGNRWGAHHLGLGLGLERGLHRGLKKRGR